MQKNYFTCKKNLPKTLIKGNLNESVFCELAQATCSSYELFCYGVE